MTASGAILAGLGEEDGEMVMEEKKPTKNKTTEVLRHLQEHGSITSMEAIELFGATRLSSIVFNLRRRGHDIEAVTERGTDRYGSAVGYARYVYHAPECVEDVNGMNNADGAPKSV